MLNPLSLNPQALLAEYGMKIAAFAVAGLLVFSSGAYTGYRWEKGNTEAQKVLVAALSAKSKTDDSTITGLRGGIKARNHQIELDAERYAALVKNSKVLQDAADARARKAQADAQKLLLNKPRPGQDVIMSGLDQVMESLP